ncbi:MAG: sterol desaturase family protein [Pseudomonadales bacterium]
MTTFARYCLYPLLWLWTLACIGVAAGRPEAMEGIVAVKGAGTVGVLLLFEWLTPLDARWGMTLRHVLRRDLPMAVVNGAFLAGTNYGLLAMSVAVAATGDGLLAGQPLLLQIVLGLVAFEALQYTLHRAMHGGGTAVTRFLWRTHAIHHLPQQLYPVMHAVFHPVNALLVRIAVQLTPIWLFGFEPFAVFVTGSIVALHGTVSHLNVDMRMGWLNYVFVGPELHRLHHAAATPAARNFAAALSVFDLLFGTFQLPREQPAALGLRTEDGYPGQHAPLALLAFPFRTPRLAAGREIRNGGAVPRTVAGEAG